MGLIQSLLRIMIYTVLDLKKFNSLLYTLAVIWGNIKGKLNFIIDWG